MIGALVVLVVIGLIGWYLWWERTEKSRKRQTCFAIYNAALAKGSTYNGALAKGNIKVAGVSVNILDMIDETDIPPTAMHTLLKKMEEQKYVIISSNTVKLTNEGVGYFRYKYLSEIVKNA